MRAVMMGAVAAVMLVAGCATIRDSRVNPFNWFGRSEAVALPQGAAVARADGRVLVSQLSALHVERNAGGAILRAVGVPPTQGWYQAALVPAPDSTAEDMIFEFVLKSPAAGSRAGAPRSREIHAAYYLTNAQLAQLSRITVRGAENALSTRR